MLRHFHLYAMKQSFGQRRGHQKFRASRSRRLTKDCDLVGITTGGCDIILDQFKSRDLIEQTLVARDVVFGLFRQAWV